MKTTIPPYEIELIIAHILKKSREYVLAHPETKINQAQKNRIDKFIARREKNEPMAHILGYKGFYGLDFKVTKHTLIPRPETEQIIDLVLKELRIKNKALSIVDVGTGSGNIIITLAHNTKHITHNKINYFAIDISSGALNIAKKNAESHKVDKKIKFIKSDLLKKFLPNTDCKLLTTNLIITANLPYLSKKIYSSAMPSVKKFEPKSALFSGKEGLAHYEKLFQQIKILQKRCYMLCVTCFVEFSPEQKMKLSLMIKKYFPRSKTIFHKDLAGKWRVGEIRI